VVLESEPLPQLARRRNQPVGEQRRAAILAATEELLRERPLARISVGDISQRAGVGRSGFYFYFASKGAVVAALLEDVFLEMVAGATHFFEGDAGDLADDVAGVRLAVFSAWESWRSHDGLFLAMLDARGTDAAIGPLWEAWLDRFVEPVASAIARRQRGTTGIAPTAVAPTAVGAPTSGPARELATILVAANERTFERLSRAGTPADQASETVEMLADVWTSTILVHHLGTPR
jgi:AcrR family transcriptional regulator